MPEQHQGTPEQHQDSDEQQEKFLIDRFYSVSLAHLRTSTSAQQHANAVHLDRKDGTDDTVIACLRPHSGFSCAQAIVEPIRHVHFVTVIVALYGAKSPV